MSNVQRFSESCHHKQAVKTNSSQVVDGTRYSTFSLCLGFVCLFRIIKLSENVFPEQRIERHCTGKHFYVCNILTTSEDLKASHA